MTKFAALNVFAPKGDKEKERTITIRIGMEERSKEIILKIKQRRLRAITLQVTNEKSYLMIG